MMITPFPTRQSWATWLIAITSASWPISVQPSAWVERCTVTYSRTTVPSPTRTPDGVPGLNFRSCGIPPSTVPWPILTRASRTTLPSVTTWWPSSTPSPSVVSGPTTQKAPIRTSAPRVADLSTTAEGWISVITARLALRRLTRERLERALKRANSPQQLGQTRLGRHDALRLEHRPRRRAEILAAGFEVRGHSGLSADERAV